VQSRTSDVATLLEEEIAAFIDTRRCGRVCITGQSGSGKTTALEHLAACFGGAGHVCLLDGIEDAEEIRKGQPPRLIVYAADSPLPVEHLAIFELSCWRDDDVIEYLLAAHKNRCASVLGRITAVDRQFLGGLPLIWVKALMGLARNEGCPDAATALWDYIRAELPSGLSLQAVNAECISLLTELRTNTALRVDATLSRLLNCRPVQLVVAINAIPALLAEGTTFQSAPILALPYDAIERIGVHCKNSPAALAHLERAMEGPVDGQALAASLLHAAGAGWRPTSDNVPGLEGARLARADWPNVNLRGCKMARADLRHAKLDGASLQGACLSNAKCRGASLDWADLSHCYAIETDFRDASLRGVRGAYADFGRANFTRAILDQAILCRAYLAQAKLAQASLLGAVLQNAIFGYNDLTDTDFSGTDLALADLTGLTLRHALFQATNFTKAKLSGCDLEDLNLTGCTFLGADLTEANLTGCILREANLQEACLKNAGLGEIDAEGADLRFADLRGASFHMGSTRGGLVGSPLACEGSRMGFYTDEYEEQGFKSPEEIRKANLCGADLRGAKIDGVDFYLVDLRGACYDAHQLEHFRRCKAILVART
jgi:uncharacterized protein YjbI with pentapeptide repeats